MNVVAFSALPDAVSARERARREQLEASDPAVSAFVGASAGSGKTKLLTDRMLRLLLAGGPDGTGADPARIQCLTFTKAAAAEMSLRLQHRLGRWVTLSDAELDRDLAELWIEPSPGMRARARALFAQVLDMPGGMRIGTIHAFCQSLLRRFPLEAQLSPHFRLVEDADARAALEEARDQVLAEAGHGAVGELAGLASAETFGRLVGILQAERPRLREVLDLPHLGMLAAMCRAVGAPGRTDAEALAAAVCWPGEGEVRRVLGLAHAHGTPAVRDKAGAMLGWLNGPSDLRARHWQEWRDHLLLADGKPRGASVFAAKRLAETYPEIVERLRGEQDRVLGVEDGRRALRVAEASTALLQLAAPVLRAYTGRKQSGGLVDYEDLIGRTRRLLIDPGAAWVLYKLDGGMDHLLLDEVQDTAPEQWQIAHTLTEEFFAGLGARDVRRTFFAVGDPKQSIYSFQGADPDEFERSRRRMGERVRRSGLPWRDVTLDVSFRSTAPVLGLVDAVFRDPRAARGVVAQGEELRHYADRAEYAGRVELWPLAPVTDEPPAEPWTVPERNLGLVSAPQRLADALAGWLAGEIRDGAMLDSRGRPLRPGDVLVLVRRRGDFARALVRALKARGVPVAGLDRLVLTEQAAVQDVLALCDTLLMPEDDLALACVLTGPLGGLADDSLMRLAMDRPGTLWDALRERAGEYQVWRQAHRYVSDLLARADHVTPHALLSEALGPMGGRARLLARLGPEAAEPLDELLNAALAYTAAHPPSLQGFVHWLRRSGATVKREAEGAGGAVRVMTVHGAKGLQAPLVILPDTTALPPEDEAFVWRRDPRTGADLPLWSPRREFRCATVDAARAAERERRLAEYNRLLYVALTRAEDRLLVCGWETRRGVPDDSWYRLVERGFHAMGATAAPFEAVGGAWEGERLMAESPQRVAVPEPRPDPASAGLAPLPGWAGLPPEWRAVPPPAEPPVPRPLAPSRPEGVDFGPVPRAASPLQSGAGVGRFRRGKLVHALLQHLPDLPREHRAAAARSYAARPGVGLDGDEVDALVEETLAVLDHPALRPLFAPGSRAEQPLTGLVGDTVVSGVVDRLAVRPDGLFVADYKANRDAPDRPEATPVLYLRQMAAYRAVLRGLSPGRPVTCALIWTRQARVQVLPDPLLDPHAPGARLGSPDPA